MLNLADPHDCSIHFVKTVECAIAPDSDAQEVCKTVVRFEVPLDESEVKTLPISTSGLKALIKESKGIDEGKNTLKIKFTRSLGLSRYTLTLDGSEAQLVQFTAEIKNQPEISIIQGQISAVWTVEAQLSPEQGAQLIRLVRREGVLMKARQAQGSLNLIEEAV